jgi:UDP-N-acetyl-D-mannosaminuronic acid dehydrogenase
VGLGYIGLPTASLLATKGFSVLGVDIDPRIVDTINRGDIHIQEPDLDILVKSAVNSGRLKAAVEPAEADVFIIAVPTPFKDGHVPDVSYVEAATRSIAPRIREGNLVILESTSPVGTSERIGDIIRELRPELSVPEWGKTGTKASAVFVAHCPERVLPGCILKELVENDRIVGGVDRASAEEARDFYALFVHGKILLSDSRTAELSKLSENAFRDVNIAFANELSRICEKLGLDVWELIELANRHPRVNILKPGPGVGGHCIAVDPWFIVSSAPEEAHLIRAAREVNDGQPDRVIQKLKNALEGLTSPRIACLGLSYKPDIDDLRESPALEIVKKAAKLGLGEILVVEPHIQHLPAQLSDLPNVKLVDLPAALEVAQVVVLLVDHSRFRPLNRSSLAGKRVIDTIGRCRN